MTVLSYRDDIAVISLGDGENRFTPGLVDDLDADLDAVLESGARGVVTTGGGKFYSNGFDLAWLRADDARAQEFVRRVQALFARMLGYPLPTAAALPGHAFGAGALWALAHDFRAMRVDRGWFCLPEVDLGVPFTGGMAALIQAKLPVGAAFTAMTTGRRFGGEQARKLGVVDVAAPETLLLDATIELLPPSGAQNRHTLAAIKALMFSQVVTALHRSAHLSGLSPAEDIA